MTISRIEETNWKYHQSNKQTIQILLYTSCSTSVAPWTLKVTHLILCEEFFASLARWFLLNLYKKFMFYLTKAMMLQNGRHNDWNYLLFGMNQASALVRWVGVRTLCVLIQCWSWLQPISVLASTLCLLLVLESALCILLMPFWLCFWLGISWMDPFV